VSCSRKKNLLSSCPQLEIFVAAGWRLRTIFKVHGVTYKQIWPLEEQLLNVDVAENASDTRKSFVCSNFSPQNLWFLFKNFIFWRTAKTLIHVCRFLRQMLWNSFLNCKIWSNIEE